MITVKMFLISDNVDTQIGLRLVGIPGVVVKDETGLKEKFEKACQDDDIAIIFVTEKLASVDPGYINEQRLNRHLPLIVEIPDRHGSIRPADYIMSYVKGTSGA
jgi:V/A-type H+-transporting ATPase subunit F